MKRVAWSPEFNYPGAAERRIWTTGEPTQFDIDYWTKKIGIGILYAYSDDDGAAEVLQSLGWHLHDGVWTEDKAATADLQALETPVRPRYQALCTKCGKSRPLPEVTEEQAQGVVCDNPHCHYMAFVVPKLFTAEEVNSLIKQALKEQA